MYDGSKVRRQDVNDQLWRLVRVNANGPGIPEKHQPHIFDRFYRLD